MPEELPRTREALRCFQSDIQSAWTELADSIQRLPQVQHAKLIKEVHRQVRATAACLAADRELYTDYISHTKLFAWVLSVLTERLRGAETEVGELQ